MLLGRGQCLHLFPSYHVTLATPPESKSHAVFPHLDTHVAQAWQIMARFCSLVNLAVDANGRIPWELFLETMTSVMYSLQYMSFPTGSLNELVRLALLALSSHVFLQWKSIPVSFDHLAASYRDSLLHADALRHLSPQATSWLLMSGAVTVFTESDDHWLRPLLKDYFYNVEVTTWSQMQKLLNSFLWVPILQENIGRTIFYSLLKTDITSWTYGQDMTPKGSG